MYLREVFAIVGLLLLLLVVVGGLGLLFLFFPLGFERGIVCQDETDF